MKSLLDLIRIDLIRAVVLLMTFTNDFFPSLLKDVTNRFIQHRSEVFKILFVDIDFVLFEIKSSIVVGKLFTFSYS